MGLVIPRAWLCAGLLIGLMMSATPMEKASADAVPGAMATGQRTSIPVGYMEFCRRQAAECRIRSGKIPPILMTSGMEDKLASVTKLVNRSIKPVSDFAVHGTMEFWSYPVSAIGDCEDYVLLKRQMLNLEGISLSNLLITVVRKKDGEGHAVLTVKTDKGDYVLDNLNDDVKLWSETGYRFLKRQSSTHTGRWVAILEHPDVLVGAVD
ncbi:MAG: transglutaminase [Mesorhizobium sp.]|uniref:transglutaminase-like cysteine peptidase n=1 Tax=unclassified Mesorhizobium TaxID=325217 RepID=UPI000FE97A01|nr:MULTISPECIES: transglutaminase-like cysteine peptidase [unclassified Mesorhizobium]RWB34192.1 MAG: transglutaminase [Mesorhizobium sp.]RWB36316.1 MAG: transglutaminase [Mesorhizobium sp.]RWB51469.1 MAG: transglutaminase [Mesorhizobium sp.]RWC25458.1 MAG: transglutaminase [Mesorhizobium sp.]RWC35062.1 MAG: transglutaminase [Mesorhizobium sp.]